MDKHKQRKELSAIFSSFSMTLLWTSILIIISLHMINVCLNFHSDSKLTPGDEYFMFFWVKIHNCTA